jgi:hypothetical protein
MVMMMVMVMVGDRANRASKHRHATQNLSPTLVVIFTLSASFHSFIQN